MKYIAQSLMLLGLAACVLSASSGTGASQERRVIPGGRAQMGPAVKKAELKGDMAKIPIVIASAQILVDDVYVNGKGPFRFLLDTGGMGGGRLDTSLVEKLGLKPTGEVTGSDGSGRPGQSMAMLEIDSLDFGGLHFEGVRVLSRDYNEFGAAVRGHIDGILGFALFEEFLLTIDYGQRSLLVEKGELPEPNGQDVLAMQGAGVPSVELELGGQKHVAHFDTGAMSSITISQEIADTLKLASEPEVIGQARTVSGAFSISRAQLDGDLKIGDIVQKNPDVVIGGPVMGVNIGGFVLRDYLVTYDQAHKRIRIQPGKKTKPEGAPMYTRVGQEPINVPMKLVMGRPAIEATINGKGPFTFILDTGAGTIVLDPKLAEELEIKPTGKTRIGDPAAPQAVEANAYELESVGVEGALFQGLNAVSMEGLSQIGVRGIIGLPAFYDTLVTLDYANETLTIARGVFGPQMGTEYKLDHDFVTLEVDVAGEKVDSHLDTGNPGIITLPLSVASKLPLVSPAQVIGRARTASGEFEVHGATLDGELSIGEITLAKPQLHFTDHFPWGNIGGGALSGRAVTIDQVNQRLQLSEATSEAEPNKAGPMPAGGEPPRYGIAMGLTGDGGMTVQQVIAGGVAEKCGLKAGDVIRKINGKDLSSLDQAAVMNAMRSSPVTLTVDRDGMELDIKLQAEDR